jgi:hypothetical protein
LLAKFQSFNIILKIYTMKKNLIFVGLLALMAFFVSCNNYGDKLTFDSLELYYTDEVTEDEANDIGEFLQEMELTDGDEKAVQIDKDGDTYLFRVVTKDGYEDDDEFVASMKYITFQISVGVLDGAPIELHLCDDTFETKKEFDVSDGDEDSEEYEIEEYDGAEIEYDSSVTFSEVDALGNYLIESGFTDGSTKSCIFIKERGTYIFKMVTSEEYWDDPEFRDIASMFAGEMSYSLFDDEPVEIHLCDEYFDTKKKVKM